MASREEHEARSALAALRAKLVEKGFFNRHPAGAAGGIGGQFAPKGTSGGGFGGGFKNYLGNLFGGSSSYSSSGPGMSTKPAGPPPGAKPHPKVNDKGAAVTINYPSKPSHKSTWDNAAKTAVFTPGSDAPDKLNGIPMRSWSPPKEGWAAVKGTNEKLDADFPFEPNPKKSVGAGVLVVEDDGRVWLTRPTNSYGGYQNTYPKGTVEDGLTMQQNAIKEAYEETGLKIKIVGVLGDYERDTSKARFYIARRTSGTPKDMGWESQAINLATLKDAKSLLNRTHDKQILEDFEDLLSFGGKLKKAKGPVSGAWTMQPRWPSGSALGGQWKAMGADGVTLPPKLAGGLEGKNPAYQKKLNAIHAAAQSGNMAALDTFISQNKDADAKYASGVKGSSHVKWSAGVYQYAVQVRGDIGHKAKASASADAISGPKKLSSYGASVGPKPGGSNPGAMYQENGQQWLVKGNAQKVAGNVTDAVSDARARNEVLASKLMQAAGVGAPNMTVIDLEGKYGGGLGVASQMIDKVNFNPNNAAHRAAAQATFATHAWLANYDVLGQGYDNTVITPNGTASCIDPGGALLFRAQGLPKGASHGVTNGLLDPSAPEFKTMRETTSEQKTVFGSMTQAQLQASAEPLKSVSDETIKKLVDTYASGTAAEKSALAANLIARRDAVLAAAGVTTAAAPVAAPQTPRETPQNALLQPQAWINAAQESAADVIKAGGTSATMKVLVDTSTPKIIPNQHVALVEQIKTLHANGDLMGLAQARAEIEAKFPPSDKFAVDLRNMTSVAMVSLAVQQQEAAKAVTPPSTVPEKPVFSTTGFANVDKFYNDMMNTFAAHHAAGDLAALESFKGMKKLYPDGMPWKTGSQNAIKASAYHAALVKDLQSKQAAQVVAGAAQADKAISTPVPPKKDAAPLTAMPNFEKAKLPAENSNAGSHNPKVDLIKALAEKGDVKGLLALPYGSNTYGKKQATLANDALKALGSPHAVTAGQKKNENPALYGGKRAPAVAAAAATVKATPPSPHPVTAPKPEKTKPTFKPENLTVPPDFNNFNNGGKPLSSKAWVNESNNAAVNAVYALAKTGNLDALKAATFEVVDKESGAKTGVFKPISEHPSQHVKAYHQNLVQEIDLQMNPPQMPRLGVFAEGTINEVAAQMPAVPSGKSIAAVPAKQKAGRYIVLGKATLTEKVPPEDNSVVSSSSWRQKAKEHYNNAPSAARSTFSTYIGTSGAKALNTALRNGNTSASVDGKSVAQHVKDFSNLLVDIPEGTTFTRNMGTKGYGETPNTKSIAELQQFLMAAEKGTVVQEPGFSSASHGSQILSNNDIKWNFRAGKGVKAFPAWLSANTSEAEALFPPNTRYMILGAKKQGKTVYVDAVLLPNWP